MSCNFVLLIFLIVFSKYAEALLKNPVLFYKETNFRGSAAQIELNDNRCVNVPPHHNDSFKSVDTRGKCVWLYQHEGCGGRSIRVAPGSPCHYDLGGCGLDFIDRTSAVSGC